MLYNNMHLSQGMTEAELMSLLSGSLSLRQTGRDLQDNAWVVQFVVVKSVKALYYLSALCK